MTPAYVDGRPCSLEEAIPAAVRLLEAARLPLVYGLVESTVEAQREAARLARLLRGVVDSAASPVRAAAHDAFTRLGLLTTSLGEIRRHADLVVFWGCDADRIHPGFLERYAPAHPNRLRLAVDLGEARGPEAAERRLALPAGREIEALLVLRVFVRGRRVEAERADALDLSLDPLRDLASRLRECSYAVLVHDADPPVARRDPARPAALTGLAQSIRPPARCRTLGLHRAGNSVGAEQVLVWQTGFPSAVSFSRGIPRHDPAVFSGEALLARGEVDAALVVGANPSSSLSAPARHRLDEIPTVALGDAASVLERAKVRLAAASPAATRGTVFRTDGLALRQKATSPLPLPSEAALLARMASLVRPRASGDAT